MPRPLLSLYLLLGLLAGCAGSALAVDLQDVIRTLETPFQATTGPEQRIRDYAASFQQESRIASLDRTQQAHGQVLVAFGEPRPGQAPEVRFRWEYHAPMVQEIVSDGKTLWVYLPDNNQVIRSELDQVNQPPETDPMTFLTGLGNLSRDFLISWAEPNRDAEGNYILELLPRKSSSLLSRLVITVGQEAVAARRQGQRPGVWFPIRSTALHDPNGNRTLIEFSDLRVNQGVASERFEFVVPTGVQVITPTGQEAGY